jgi:hypothetical protein
MTGAKRWMGGASGVRCAMDAPTAGDSVGRRCEEAG